LIKAGSRAGKPSDKRRSGMKPGNISWALALYLIPAALAFGQTPNKAKEGVKKEAGK
jgi:hypothetical protein